MVEDLDGEEWRDIKGYEGLYQVSNFTRVKSCDRFVFKSMELKDDLKNLKEKLLVANVCGTGYKKVVLCKNGEIENKNIHRLVAEAFIPNPDNKPCVNHIDCDKTNNNIENLEWCTQSENAFHAHRNNLTTPSMYWLGVHGKNNPLSKVIYQFTKEKELIGMFYGSTEVESILGIHQGNVSLCAKKSRNFAGGFRWSYDKNDKFIEQTKQAS